jgi:predicted transcriptional regulator
MSAGVHATYPFNPLTSEHRDATKSHMSKTEVYSWRIDPDLKRRLEEAARAEATSIARLLARIAREWLDNEEAEQSLMRAEAAKWIGSINSGDGHGSARAKERVRAKLLAKHKRLQREAPESRRR